MVEVAPSTELAIDAARLAPGFGDPVHDAQATFRAVLDAMAHPGRLVELPARLAAPAPLGEAAIAVVLTLCDVETPLWLDPGLAPSADYLRFHCGVPLTSPDLAHFALIGDPHAMPPLDAFALGSDEYPDRSTTLIIEVEQLQAGRGMILSGPGIADTARLAVSSFPERFWAERQLLAELFPRGLDVILTCGSLLAALPRTTRVAA
ncbi:MAG TPA: phosphonate C-P lyase system protein PhnH [Stellaceae bacterium]|nr:phosphonate C-P lyase system protein PhnH [Stellaceae bacterium]